MDINKWLADAAVVARRPEQPGNPGGKEHGKTAPVLGLESSKKRRARRHQDVSKDSSIIAPEDVPTEVPARRLVRHAHQDSVGDAPSEQAGHSSQLEQACHSSQLENEDEVDANPYQRRKRHKTKADRYDPKPREQETHQHGEMEKRRPSKKVKEAKRKKKDKSAPVVVRNFHAANVPRERLTVSMLLYLPRLVNCQQLTSSSCSLEQPLESSRRARPHLHFGAGVVSVHADHECRLCINPKGYAVPDLAFSEMNFLSKRRFAAEEVADTEEPHLHKRRKKDRKRATEEEISSYFAPLRLPLVEKSLNGPTAQNSILRDQYQHMGDLQRQSSTASTVPSIRPTVEKPAAPDLNDRKSCQHSISNTCFTWSDSLRHSSRPAIGRPVSTTDLEAYRAKSVSAPLAGEKLRASSYDLRPPDLAEKRQVIRSQNTSNQKRNLAGPNTNILPGEFATSSSLPRLNQLREATVERTTSESLPRTARGSVRGIASHSLPAAMVSTIKEAPHEEPTVSIGTKVLQADQSTPVSDGQDPFSASIANLLHDCDTAYLSNMKVRPTRFPPTHLDRRAMSDASAIRHSYHIHQNPVGNETEVEEEDVLFNGLNDRFFSNQVPQMEDSRTLAEQYYTYEPEEEEETLHHLHPDIIGRGEQIPRPQATVPTPWPRYETHHRPAIQYPSMGDILMTDLERDEEQASEQLDFVEEAEEDDFADFWKPNMLY